MTLTIPTGYAQCRLIFVPSGAGVRMSVNYGVHVGSSASFEDIATAIAGAWADNLKDITASTCTLDTIAVVDEESAFEVQVTAQGDSTAFDWDTYEAVVVKFQTGIRGAANRGRQYWPGLLPAGSVAIDGSLGPATVEAFTAPFTGFFADQIDSTAVDNFVVLHTNSDTPTIVTTTSISNRVGIQRRRRVHLV